MNNYVDRGIIKWAPFDGLAGFNDLYNDLKYRLGKKINHYYRRNNYIIWIYL